MQSWEPEQVLVVLKAHRGRKRPETDTDKKRRHAHCAAIKHALYRKRFLLFVVQLHRAQLGLCRLTKVTPRNELDCVIGIRA